MVSHSFPLLSSTLLNTKLSEIKFLNFKQSHTENVFFPVLILITSASDTACAFKINRNSFALGKKCQITYINGALKLCTKDFQFSQHRQMYLYKSGHHLENRRYFTCISGLLLGCGHINLSKQQHMNKVQLCY